jgi:hypothetical protein
MLINVGQLRNLLANLSDDLIILVPHGNAYEEATASIKTMAKTGNLRWDTPNPRFNKNCPQYTALVLE